MQLRFERFSLRFTMRARVELVGNKKICSDDGALRLSAATVFAAVVVGGLASEFTAFG
jgi:hypothetical protein